MIFEFNLALVFPSKNWRTILSKNSAFQPWSQLGFLISILCVYRSGWISSAAFSSFSRLLWCVFRRPRRWCSRWWHRTRWGAQLSFDPNHGGDRIGWSHFCFFNFQLFQKINRWHFTETFVKLPLTLFFFTNHILTLITVRCLNVEFILDFLILKMIKQNIIWYDD